jgi:heme iron utilization protein
MEPHLSTLINLLHRCETAALATHSTRVIDYPFASAVSFSTDEHHRPTLLMSRLAQHAMDIGKDNRSSFVVYRLRVNGEMERATLVGSIQPVDPEPLLIERYLRYHPEANDLVQGSDCRFFRMEASQLHVVGRGEQGGWITADQLVAAPWLPLAFERDVINSLEPPAQISVLGVDCQGIDLQAAHRRQRFSFGRPIVVAGKARAVAQELLDRLRR